MNFYRFIRWDNDTAPQWHDTLGEAHAAARRHQGNERRIELFDIPTDKAGVLALLRGTVIDEFEPPEVQRTWAITPRGGLKEVPNGE